MPPCFEKLHEVMELPVDVATNGYGTVNRLDIGLLDEDFFHLTGRGGGERVQGIGPRYRDIGEKGLNIIEDWKGLIGREGLGYIVCGLGCINYTETGRSKNE